jgi:hypothetical protein
MFIKIFIESQFIFIIYSKIVLVKIPSNIRSIRNINDDSSYINFYLT